MGEHAFGSSALSGRSGWGVLAGVTVLSLGAIFPIALSNERGASAGALVMPRVRSAVIDVLHTADLVAVQGADSAGEGARLVVDGRDDTAWTGRPGEAPWRLSASFARPLHIGLLRAHFGQSSTIGVPTEYHWEVSHPLSPGAGCDVSSTDGEHGWTPIDGASQASWQAGPWGAQTTRRSWFVDVDACALRLVIDRTNAGPPVVSELHAIESARDLLRDAEAQDDGAWPGFSAGGAIDGSYEARWAGAAGRSQWTLRVDLPEPRAIDRVRLVLGFDATSVPRSGSGRSYAIAWAPVRYSLEASEDGTRFVPIAAEPLRSDGSILPLRRRLVTLPKPRTVCALRLVMTGATGASGVPEAGAVPVVREIAAYGADDPQPVLAPPWILSINANPSAESHAAPGGEWANDVYHAKFLQGRFAKLLPSVRHDDLYARLLGPHGELLAAPPTDDAGVALESIEGDDPVLDTQLLAQSSPERLERLGLFAADGAGPRRALALALGSASRRAIGRHGPARPGRARARGPVHGLLRRSSNPGVARSGRLTSSVVRRGQAAHRSGASAHERPPHPRFCAARGRRASVAGRSASPAGEDPICAPRPSLRRHRGPAEAIHDAVAPRVARGRRAPRCVLAGRSAAAPPGPGLQRVLRAGGRRRRSARRPLSKPLGSRLVRRRSRGVPVEGSRLAGHRRPVSRRTNPPESVADPRLFLAGAYEQIVDAYQRLSP